MPDKVVQNGSFDCDGGGQQNVEAQGSLEQKQDRKLNTNTDRADQIELAPARQSRSLDIDID